MIILWRLYAWLLYRDNIRRPYYDIYRNIQAKYLANGGDEIRLLHIGCGVRTFEEFINDLSGVLTHAHDFHRRLIFSRKVQYIDESHYAKDLDKDFTENRGEQYDVVLIEQAFANIKYPYGHLVKMKKLIKHGGKLVAIVASKPSKLHFRILRWMLNIGQIPHFTEDEVSKLFRSDQIRLFDNQSYWLVVAQVEHFIEKQSDIATCPEPERYRPRCA